MHAMSFSQVIHSIVSAITFAGVDDYSSRGAILSLLQVSARSHSRSRMYGDSVGFVSET